MIRRSPIARGAGAGARLNYIGSTAKSAASSTAPASRCDMDMISTPRQPGELPRRWRGASAERVATAFRLVLSDANVKRAGQYLRRHQPLRLGGAGRRRRGARDRHQGSAVCGSPAPMSSWTQIIEESASPSSARRRSRRADKAVAAARKRMSLLFRENSDGGGRETKMAPEKS